MKKLILISVLSLLLISCSSIDGFIEGENGVSHGAITAGVAGTTYSATGNKGLAVAAAGATSIFFVRRELQARETGRYFSWPIDSRMDAAIPLLVAGTLGYLYYKCKKRKSC